MYPVPKIDIGESPGIKKKWGGEKFSGEKVASE
jgi:hypothetical protein